MDLLCRIRHPNIVSLLGYSNDGQTRFLVYELMQNGSLESQLHGIILYNLHVAKRKGYSVQGE